MGANICLHTHSVRKAQATAGEGSAYPNGVDRTSFGKLMMSAAKETTVEPDM